MTTALSDLEQQPNTKRQYRVIDADSHLLEPESMWTEYLPENLKALGPRVVFDGDGYSHLCAAGITWERDAKKRTTGTPPPPERGGFDPAARLQAMDDEGVDITVCYPTTGLKLAGILDVEILTGFCRAYNNWIHDFRSVAPERLFPMAFVPQLDVRETLVETRLAISELGLPGIFMRPNAIGRTLDDPVWEPLWTLLEELDVPLGLHEGTVSTVHSLGDDRSENHMVRHMMSHPFEHMQAMLQLIGGGVLERHPNLRVFFVEAGCGWVPYWLERMDHHQREWAHLTLPLAMSPTEYFMRQCFVSADSEERDGLSAVLATVGPDGICWSTDYPHADHTWKGMASEFTNRKDISSEVKAKIVGGNAARAFKI